MICRLSGNFIHSPIIRSEANLSKIGFHFQVELYEDFARSRAKKGVDDVVSSISEEQKESKKASTQGASHIFQVPKFFSIFLFLFLQMCL